MRATLGTREHRRPAGVLEDAALAVIVLDDHDTVVEALGDPGSLADGPFADLVGRPAADAIDRVATGAVVPAPGETSVVESGGRRIELRRVRAGPAATPHSVVIAIDLTAHLGDDAAHRDQTREVQLLFRQLPGAVWTTDVDLHITHFLGQVEINLGIAHDQLTHLSVYDIARTRDPGDPATAAHVAALRGEASSFRYQLRDRWYEVHVEPLRDDTGTIAGCIGAAVDVTRRLEIEARVSRMEAQLAEAQRRSISLLEATLESTADGILVVDSGGHVVAFNTQFATMWRVPSELVEARDDAALLQFVRDQLVDPDGFMTGVRELYEDPDARRLDTFEFLDGRVFERYSRPQCVDGVTFGRVWSFRDVTERERSLQHATFLADASRLLETLDAEPALEGVTRLAVPLLGEHCAISLLGDGLPPRVIASAPAAAAICARIPPAVLAGHSVLRPEGERALMSAPLVAAGRVLGAITVARPVQRMPPRADRELIEEVGRRCAVALENSRLYQTARDDIRAREEFLAVASHEIRGPIASIRLAVEALRQGLAPSPKLIDVIDREERRLARLVDELLDLGRVQAGQLEFVIEQVDLVAIAREAAARLEPELARSGSTLTIRGDPEVIGHWDRLRLDQVVSNLVSNAIKFGLGKPIELVIRAHEGRAILTITDHGIGIRADMQATIFDPFERAVPARHYGGLGLGLYIVRTIVTGLRGTINVRSVDGEGATFVVELPLEPAR